MSEPVRNFKQIIRIKGTGDDAYPNPGTLMLWGDNWTLLDWIRQHTDYSKDTRTTPVDVDGCKAARSLLEDAIRDMTQEQGTL